MMLVYRHRTGEVVREVDLVADEVIKVALNNVLIKQTLWVAVDHEVKHGLDDLTQTDFLNEHIESDFARVFAMDFWEKIGHIFQFKAIDNLDSLVYKQGLGVMDGPEQKGGPMEDVVAHDFIDIFPLHVLNDIILRVGESSIAFASLIHLSLSCFLVRSLLDLRHDPCILEIQK